MFKEVLRGDQNINSLVTNYASEGWAAGHVAKDAKGAPSRIWSFDSADWCPPPGVHQQISWRFRSGAKSDSSSILLESFAKKSIFSTLQSMRVKLCRTLKASGQSIRQGFVDVDLEMFADLWSHHESHDIMSSSILLRLLLASLFLDRYLWSIQSQTWRGR